MKRIEVAGVPQGITQLIQGSMMLRVEDMAYSNELLDAYAAAGGNAIDTGHVYGASSAQAIGKWMETRGNRGDIVVIGKGAHPYGEPRMTKTCIQSDLVESLERLATDYMDVYLLHRDEPNVHVGYILEGLNDQLASGRCRAIGASNWSVARIREANVYAAKNGLTGFSCSSPNLGLARPNEPRWAGCVTTTAEDEAWHEESQLPILSWSSQSGGFFTDRYSQDNRDDAEMVRVNYSEGNWERKRRAAVLADRYAVTANQIALAYVLNQPFPVAAIIGPQKPSELQDSVHALPVSLTADERAWLNLSSENEPA
ncbi:aldo/keto reductase [Paenibacillus sacheonensis]|uniref:Aldo/keto reductase n=1 Tax=Paenibacillus sacheonensis TaxID=742054 RepID=A0A7X5C3N7_9BACL|nr:aldo/keto reductase [Paenibacillus sacheonensis]MBM7566917.1 aryl-alcohol dehydrogenase-like predicted oxidoreductase [Paenibacillus sacheonensis]NBC71539.1 aldo/keto reductase [Paenibacillus sacheonensis]